MKFIRQRYILFEIISTEEISISEESIKRAIWKHFMQIFGEHLAFRLGLWIIRWDPINNIGILRCENVTKYSLIATLAMIKKIDGHNIIMHTRKTSGTVKSTVKLWEKEFNTPAPKREKQNF
ncbi:MAG: Rpp14/Pop5 family protein [Promethearchaeota archaeon]